MSDERQPVYVDQMPDEPVAYLPLYRPRTVGERLAEIEARWASAYEGIGGPVEPFESNTDLGWCIATPKRLLEVRDDR